MDPVFSLVFSRWRNSFFIWFFYKRLGVVPYLEKTVCEKLNIGLGLGYLSRRYGKNHNTLLVPKNGSLLNKIRQMQQLMRKLMDIDEIIK